MATNAGCGLLVVSFSPSGAGARKDRPSISWVAFSWRPEPPGAEARPQRPPRRSAAAAALHRSVCVNQLVGGYPVGRTSRTRTARIILAKICRLASSSLALPPAGRVVEPGGREPPVRSADCTSRLGPHSRQRTAERADWRTGRRPPADWPPARCRAAVGASLHRHHNGQRAVSHLTS